jgi:uncharacterized metal-binding protein
LTAGPDRDKMDVCLEAAKALWESFMAGTVLNLLFLGFLILAATVCIVAPLGALCVMFWHWHKELEQIIRLKQARSTQVR